MAGRWLFLGHILSVQQLPGFSVAVRWTLGSLAMALQCYPHPQPRVLQVLERSVSSFESEETRRKGEVDRVGGQDGDQA